MTTAFIAYLLLALISFALHGLWEKMHIVLYRDYDAMKGRLPVHVFATVGDVQYTFLIVAGMALAKRDAVWFLETGVAEYVLLAVLGFLVALFVEYKAFALKRWQYTDAMPIIPVCRVGLSPIVQMTALLPLSVLFTSLIISFI